MRLRERVETFANNVLASLLVAVLLALLPSIGAIALKFPWPMIVALGFSVLAAVLSVISAIRLNGFISKHPEAPTERPQPVYFESQGFYWELTHNFWPAAQAFDAEQAITPGSGGFIGPLCPQANCKIDVSDDLKSDTPVCHRCGTTLQPAVPIRAENRPHFISALNSDPLYPLRKAAYRDAQAAMRRGDIADPRRGN